MTSQSNNSEFILQILVIGVLLVAVSVAVSVIITSFNYPTIDVGTLAMFVYVLSQRLSASTGLLLFSVIVLIPLYNQLHVNNHTELASTVQVTRMWNRRELLGAMALAEGAMVLILASRYLVLGTPTGWDTGFYVYQGEIISLEGVSHVFDNARVIPNAISFLVWSVTGSISMTGMALPFIFGGLFCMLVFLAAYRVFGSSWSTIVVSISSVCTYSFARLTYDLYAQVLSLGFLVLLLSLIATLHLRGTDESASLYTETGLILLVVGLLSVTHLSFTLWSIVFLCPYLVLARRPRRIQPITIRELASHVRNMTRWQLGLSTVILLTGALGVFAIWGALGSLSSVIVAAMSETRPLQPLSLWMAEPFLKEPFLILFVAAAGASAVRYGKDPRSRFMALIAYWNAFALIAAIATGYAQAYRFALLVLVPFYVPSGLSILWRRLESTILERRIASVSSKTVRRVKQVAIVVFLLLVIS
ncbi:MAG: hypothetical protein QXS20_05000, partial [Candidatus Thorarchaeota archaeon]